MASSGVRTRQEVMAEFIMNTNNSCIVSKRSVEKIYFGVDDGFFRPFVKKFQRRSPLINRGYWLRMQAVNHTVKSFLNESDEPKFIVNLGAGYDTLAFSTLESEASAKEATFVDVDYPELIQTKAQVINDTKKITDIIGETTTSTNDNGVLVSSSKKNYYAVGCDLAKTDSLTSLLTMIPKLKESSILFIAEVAMTYMDVSAADSVIKWAAGWQDARFCLLEQFLPDGAAHPFAQKMLHHFVQLHSPIKCPMVYPSLGHQRHRFREAGWKHVNARPLLAFWNDDSITSATTRVNLDSVEPFDEWEEFFLFAGHYFVLLASKTPTSFMPSDQEGPLPGNTAPARNIRISFSENSHNGGERRHGASVCLDGRTVVHHGGHGRSARLDTTDVYIPTTGEDAEGGLAPAQAGIRDNPAGDVVGHTITRLGKGNYVLVGGRRSPDEASSKCFQFLNGTWQSIPALPWGLYRHCAAAVGGDQYAKKATGVLVFGGKKDRSTITGDFLYWTPGKPWQTLEVISTAPRARFGASIIAQVRLANVVGYLTGGISQTGQLCLNVWEWRLDLDFSQPKILCREVTSRLSMPAGMTAGDIIRFGATLVAYGRFCVLLGGVAGNRVLREPEEVIVISESLTVSYMPLAWPGSRPLLAGFGAVVTDRGEVVISGGGGVLFSFGSFWNQGVYALDITQMPPRVEPRSWSLLLEGEPTPAESRDDGAAPNQSVGQEFPFEIHRGKADTEKDFLEIVHKGLPQIIQGLDIGACTTSWTPEYLKSQVGEDREVTIHRSKSYNMNFVKKNFEYSKESFGKLVDSAVGGEHVYLRTVSRSRPAEQATNLEDDFPTLANDFSIPSPLALVLENMHSCPLRISGPVNMWLHYVMANVLFQVRGSKRLVLFPPEDVKHLEFPHGASSSTTQIFDDAGTRLQIPRATSPYEAILKPGDALYIPALWLHTASPTSGLSVAVNVFFRSFDRGYAPGKDVYANRDVQAYETGRRDVARIVNTFRGLPAEAQSFYLSRLAQELEDAACAKSSGSHANRR